MFCNQHGLSVLQWLYNLPFSTDFMKFDEMLLTQDVHLWTGNPAPYVTSHPGQFSLPSAGWEVITDQTAAQG